MPLIAALVILASTPWFLAVLLLALGVPVWRSLVATAAEQRGVDPFVGDSFNDAEHDVVPNCSNDDGDESGGQHGDLTYDFSGLSVDDLFEKSCRGPSPLADAAIFVLSRRSSEPGVSSLGERLKQIGRDEKEPVIRALGRIGCAEYVPSLAAGGAARRDGDPPSETEIASGAMGLVRREFSSGWYGYGG